MDLTLAGNTNANYYEYIVKGAILLLAVWLDTYAKSRSTVDRGAA
jgi:ABC-type xylose transport system permease subunit